MMKLINLIKLLVLVVFPQLSVASPPMLGSCGSSATRSLSHFHNAKSVSKGDTNYGPSCIEFNCYEDLTEYDYKITAPTGEKVLENEGRNTDVVFAFDNKVMFHTKDNVDDLYNVDFHVPASAALFANRIISTNPRYSKCTGSNTYNVKELYKLPGRSPLDLSDNWCIFKDTIRQTNVTTFTIKWVGYMGHERGLIGVLRPDDFRLERVEGAGKFELSVVLNGEAIGPTYVLETSTPDKLAAFMEN